MSAAETVAGMPAPGTAAPPVPAPGWLLRRSAWLAAPVFSAGLLTGPLLLVLGRRAGLPRFLWLGGFYTAALIPAFLMSVEAGPIMRTVLWVIGSLHCLALNPQWLRNRWQAQGGTSRSRRDDGATFDQADSGPAAELLADPALQPDAYFAESAETAASAGHGPADAGSRSGRAGSLVDVNSAPVTELMRLPGVGRTRAARAVERRSEKPFSSLQDFGDRVGLGPRRLDRLRGAVRFGPAPHVGPAGPERDVPAFGWRVDY